MKIKAKLKEKKMGKANRGAGVRKLPNKGKGTCPKCGTTQIKLLYTGFVAGKEVKVCKRCKS